MNKFITSFVLALVVFLLGNVQQSLANNYWENFENVKVNKQWKIKFNANIDEASVLNNVYILQGTTKIPTVTTVEVNTIVVKPKENLQRSTDYQLIVNKQIKDTAGRYIKNAVTVPFTTEGEKFVVTKDVQTFTSEYEMTWNLPSKDYRNFYLVGTDSNGEIVGGYDTRKDKQLFGIKIGAKISTVSTKYGSPVKAILKNNVNYTQNYIDSSGNVTSGTYLIDGKYVTFFYDIHAGNTVRSIYWVDQKIEATKPGFYRTAISTAYHKSMEDLMVHLISQSRVAVGLNDLTYTPSYNSIARNHSIDMAENNYFSHTSLSGKSLKDRMNAGNLQFSWYGENIAYGQYSTIHAHEALMNSLGHRENILRKEFTHMISGIAFNSTKTPYYTVNFYRK